MDDVTPYAPHVTRVPAKQKTLQPQVHSHTQPQIVMRITIKTPQRSLA
jgi:hypothetical protein